MVFLSTSCADDVARPFEGAATTIQPKVAIGGVTLTRPVQQCFCIVAHDAFPVSYSFCYRLSRGSIGVDVGAQFTIYRFTLSAAKLCSGIYELLEGHQL